MIELISKHQSFTSLKQLVTKKGYLRIWKEIVIALKIINLKDLLMDQIENCRNFRL